MLTAALLLGSLHVVLNRREVLVSMVWWWQSSASKRLDLCCSVMTAAAGGRVHQLLCNCQAMAGSKTGLCVSMIRVA